ncbi:MAG: cyclic nucleotide-binding domain-containing protein [Burkholderiales bacterium]|nr:MAG: cyclic nucleotide-binding domain-containing protein [Burkholderiales bacterium]
MSKTSSSSLPPALQQRGFSDLGDAQEALQREADQLRQSASLLEDFNLEELAILGAAMRRITAQSGQILIEEGEAGDWMLLILQGTVDVTKRIMQHDTAGQPTTSLLEVSRLAVVRAGASLGEMSMLDSELRNATCTAIDAVEIAILTRAAIGRLIAQHPAVGAKLLIKITQLLAQRLRNTSAQLVKAVVEGKQRQLFKP